MLGIREHERTKDFIDLASTGHINQQVVDYNK